MRGNFTVGVNTHSYVCIGINIFCFHFFSLADQQAGSPNFFIHLLSLYCIRPRNLHISPIWHILHLWTIRSLSYAQRHNCPGLHPGQSSFPLPSIPSGSRGISNRKLTVTTTKVHCCWVKMSPYLFCCRHPHVKREKTLLFLAAKKGVTSPTCSRKLLLFYRTTFPSDPYIWWACLHVLLLHMTKLQSLLVWSVLLPGTPFEHDPRSNQLWSNKLRSLSMYTMWSQIRATCCRGAG